jgi:AcrR family transcriptional regulator
LNVPKPATRKETSARNREKLLDAAAKVIGKSGLVGASLQEIASAAGLTKGAVYSQFDSKEDLLVELLDRRFEIGHAQLLEVLSGDVPMAERLVQLDAWHRGERGSGRLWATLELELSIAAARQPKLRRKLRSRQRRSREFLAQMIERVADEHNLNLPLPPEDFAVVLSALSDGLLVHWLSDPKAVPNDLFARFIIASVIAPSASQTS